MDLISHQNCSFVFLVVRNILNFNTMRKSRVIEKLKSELSTSSQLLVMIQGEAGTGKSTMAETFAIELKLKLLFAATTGTAAAPLKAVTINSLFALGLIRTT